MYDVNVIQRHSQGAPTSSGAKVLRGIKNRYRVGIRPRPTCLTEYLGIDGGRISMIRYTVLRNIVNTIMRAFALSRRKQECRAILILILRTAS